MACAASWTTASLTTLIHGLALSPSDASTLLPHTDAQITTLVRSISRSLHNPSTWTQTRHTRAVLKTLTGRSPPTKPRRKRCVQPPKHRISLQLIPATPHDDARVRAVGAYPFVEVVLKGGRRVWDVVEHLYQKWGLPVVIDRDRKIVSVDTLVCQLVEKGCRTVRIPYRVLEIDIDWSILGRFADDGVRVAGKRRVSAPRDDDFFWTGGYSGKPANAEARKPDVANCVNLDNGGVNGEETVMTRLRTHLEKLDRNFDNATRVEHAVEDAESDEHDPAVIPERFLSSCSRFDLVNPLPDSLLSLGKSHGGSGDALQVMNDALVVGNRADGVAIGEVDLRCDERLDGEFAGIPLPDASLGLSALFRE